MKHRIRLLMVEDSEDDAELIRLELERSGLELTWKRVETEPAFVAALEQPWDLILSDFHMPEFNGLRAFALYRERRIDTPFLFVSGELGEDRAVEAMRAGARDYLLKHNLSRLNVAVARELGEAENRSGLRAAEEATRQEQHRLALSIEATGAGVFEHQSPLGTTLYVSDRCASIIGCDLRAIPTDGTVVSWLRDRIHRDKVPDVNSAYAEFLAGRAERFHLELRFRHEDGRWLDLAAYAKAIERDDVGRAIRIVGVILDVTEHRRLEVQLLQSQKMDAIGRLAGGIAHDFNNLLTAILSFSTLAMEDVKRETSAYGDLEEVVKAARRAEGLTGQLLAFTRQKPISPRVVNLNVVITDIDRMLARVLREDIDRKIVLADDLWNVCLDPSAFEQVLVNLAVNARDAMPGGGRLVIETRNLLVSETHEPARRVRTVPGEYVVVAVSDTGIGMSEEIQRQLFEPFFTTKELGKGTGLGLSTCYGIVKQAGGSISVYSEVGVGTTFRIYLPRAAGDTDAISASRKVESLRGHETILVAEDDAQVRHLTVRALTRLGYRVLEAANGVEALSLFVDRSESIDLLFTDVVMPEMNGKLLADRARAIRPELRVLYMSGYTENTILEGGMLTPGVDLIEKPFTPEDLGCAVRAALDRHR